MTVFQKLSIIQKSLAETGIGKSEWNEQQKFKYRGIDALLNTLSPILSANQVMIMPDVKSVERTEFTTKNGSKFNRAEVKIDYHFIDCEGEDTKESAFTLSAVGEGADQMDKAVSKAMTAAYKYALIQAFCIPLVGTDDPDAQALPLNDDVVEALSEDEVAAIKSAIDDLNGMLAEPLDVKEWCQWLCEVDEIEQIPANQMARATNALAAIRRKHERSASE